MVKHWRSIRRFLKSQMSCTKREGCLDARAAQSGNTRRAKDERGYRTNEKRRPACGPAGPGPFGIMLAALVRGSVQLGAGQSQLSAAGALRATNQLGTVKLSKGCHHPLPMHMGSQNHGNSQHETIGGTHNLCGTQRTHA